MMAKTKLTLLPIGTQKYHIIDVEYLGNYELEIAFHDGTVKSFSFVESVLHEDGSPLSIDEFQGFEWDENRILWSVKGAGIMIFGMSLYECEDPIKAQEL